MRDASSLAEPTLEKSSAPFAFDAAPKWARWAALAFVAHFAISAVLATLLAVRPSSGENRILLVWLFERDRVVWGSSDFDPALCDVTDEGLIAAAALQGLQLPYQMASANLYNTPSGGSSPITLKLQLSIITSALTLALLVGLAALARWVAVLAVGLIAAYSLCAVGAALFAAFGLTFQVVEVCGAV